MVVLKHLLTSQATLQTPDFIIIIIIIIIINKNVRFKYDLNILKIG